VKKIYKEYFQKSKVFLYPLLGIKKGVRFVPVQTYISWGEKYTIDQGHLLCLYVINNDNKEDFNRFSNVTLASNKYFSTTHNLDENNVIYVFKLKTLKQVIKKFIDGKYSTFSKRSKEKILSFFGETGSIAEYIESYLYPGYYWDDYSNFLNVDVSDLQRVGELCDKPDMQKEDFTFDCELIKKELYLKKN